MREQLASIWKNLEEYICCALLGVIMTLYQNFPPIL